MTSRSISSEVVKAIHVLGFVEDKFPEEVVLAIIIEAEGNQEILQDQDGTEQKVSRNVFTANLNIIFEEIVHLLICANVVGNQDTLLEIAIHYPQFHHLL